MHKSCTFLWWCWCAGSLTQPCVVSCSVGKNCLNGVCVPSTNQTNATCTDSDGGLNYYVKGNVSVNEQIYVDICNDHDGLNHTIFSRLDEYYCAGNSASISNYLCPMAVLTAPVFKIIKLYG